MRKKLPNPKPDMTGDLTGNEKDIGTTYRKSRPEKSHKPHQRTPEKEK